MDELIAKVAADAGIDPALARKALAIIISFLSREAPADHAQALLDKLPGARELAGEATGGGSGIMGAFNELSSAGLGLGSVQRVVGSFVAYAREKSGDAEVDAVINAIPGLNQFV
jgi:hypothetical protein